MSTSTEKIPFRRQIQSEAFVYGAEVVTQRGIAPSQTPARSASLAEALLSDPRIAWVSVTDNPGGAPMLPPDWLTSKYPHWAEALVIHLTCKDLNRTGLESTAWRYAAQGTWNVLALTGDYATVGFHGIPSGVFDLDSVGLITLLESMNRGLEVPGRRGNMETLPATDFFVGCAVSPFKRYERELLPQFFKLLRKIRAGARWVLPQLGYDMRKFHEIKLFLQANGLDEIPVLGNVYLLTRGVARMFHRGRLAGCVVSDELLEAAEKYGAGEDKGRAFFRELAAKQLAVFKGLGFAGGYLGGISKPETFFDIIEQSERFGEDDWKQFLPEITYSLPDEFFLFEHDPETGQSSPDAINREYLRSLELRPKSEFNSLSYRLSRLVHQLAFTRDKALYGPLRGLYRRWDRADKPKPMFRLANLIEKSSKWALYGCEDCGDCSLPETTYLCPRSACEKGQRNGPCGGSRDGRCEVREERECLWAIAYDRSKRYGETEPLRDRDTVIHNPELEGTSSWANFYLERDHQGGKKSSEKTSED
jgi:methylenetetrahydrofolate reductase (NADPH)